MTVYTKTKLMGSRNEEVEIIVVNNQSHNELGCV